MVTSTGLRTRIAAMLRRSPAPEGSSPSSVVISLRAVRVLVFSALVGVIVGFGTSLFFLLIEAFVDGARFIRDVTGPRLAFLIPVVGMLATAIIVKQLGPHGFGHGFPEVIQAVVRRRARIGIGLTLRKTVASAICIAWGGMVGRIGPVTHIGAMIGSAVGRAFHLPTHVLKLLLGCGAAAALAASFQAPLAGVLFASEVVLRQFNVDVILPLVIASVIGSSIPRPILRERIAFDIPVFQSLNAAELSLFVLLGLLAGCLSVLFIQSLKLQYKHYTALPIGWYGRAAAAGLAIGLIAMALPEILLINHGMTTEFLQGAMDAWLLLAVALVLPVMTGLTLSGGGSGGIFTPSLAMGAALGSSIGRFLQQLPWTVSAPGAYAVVGAAAVLAGAVRSPLTAMVLVMEVTGNYAMLLPLMTATVFSIFLSRMVSTDSALTVARTESDVETDDQWVNILRDIYVDELLDPDVDTLPASRLLSETPADSITSDRSYYVVESNGRLVGRVRDWHLQDRAGDKASKALRLRDLAEPERYLLTPGSDVLGAFHEFGIRSVSALPVVNNAGERILVGRLTRTTLLQRYRSEHELQLRI